MPRQKEFDPERVLEKAMGVFWEKGYHATSVRDLVERMGINRFSMYDTFGGKRQLFLAALDRYTRRTRDGMLGALERSDQGLPAIRQYLMSVVDEYSARSGWRGCLMINSAWSWRRTTGGRGRRSPPT